MQESYYSHIAKEYKEYFAISFTFIVNEALKRGCSSEELIKKLYRVYSFQSGIFIIIIKNSSFR